MKLYLVHCGFYDTSIAEGIFESHTNFFVAAASFEEARQRAKENEGFRARKMHVDGIQEISVVCGYRIRLDRDSGICEFETRILSKPHRDLAPKLGADRVE